MRNVEIPEQNVDAIACWVPRHGPAVIVNARGVHSHEEKGQRTTPAHEICHLLIDRTGALPLAEILNGSAPRNLAYDRVVNAPDRASAANELRSAGVSKEIIA